MNTRVMGCNMYMQVFICNENDKPKQQTQIETINLDEKLIKNKNRNKNYKKKYYDVSQVKLFRYSSN